MTGSPKRSWTPRRNAAGRAVHADRLPGGGGARAGREAIPAAGLRCLLVVGPEVLDASVSARGSSDLFETMITRRRPGPAFHTERATSGATRTTVPSGTSTISSSSLNWSVPDATK